MAKFLKIVNGYLRPVSETNTIPIYYQTYSPGTTITAGSAVTLPASGSYVGNELQVIVNNSIQTYLLDYNFVGTGTKTQISFTYDLFNTDTVVFFIQRAN